MRLNTKIALVLVVPMLGLTGILAWAIQTQVMGRFAALEQAQQTQNHSRLQEAIDAELESLERLTRDWGVYDESYDFMRGENPGFVEANFTEATFDNLQLDGILMFDTQHQPRTHFGFDKQTSKFIPLGIGLVNRIAQSLAERKSVDDGGRGILEFDGRVAQLAISPILDSDAEKRSLGSLVMMRYLDQGAVDGLAKRIKLSLQFTPLKGPRSQRAPADALAALRRTPLWLRIDDDTHASSFSMLNDLAGHPTLMMQATMPRDIFREGQATARQLLGFTFAALSLFVIGTFFAIRLVALKRLSRLSHRLVSIGTDGGNHERLSDQGNDEISRVATSINAMLDGLDRAYEQRRRAGERQRELNALLVRIATDESIAHGDATALFQVLGGSLAAGAALDAWSLWLADPSGQSCECLRASESATPTRIGAEWVQRWLADGIAGRQDAITLAGDGDDGYRGLVFPFDLDDRRGALAVEAFEAGALRQNDELNFLIAATRLIERSLRTHFQNLREQALREKAELDGLTGLANRSRFEAGLRRALDQSVGNERRVGLLFIDLDRFKPINDTYGHDVGDWLLCQVATRLSERVRADDLVARLGGDEFTIVLTSIRSPGDAERVADKISEALNAPFEHANGLLQAGASIGLAWSPEHGQGVADLVKAADQAMYAAKQAGGGRWIAAKQVLLTL